MTQHNGLWIFGLDHWKKKKWSKIGVPMNKKSWVVRELSWKLRSPNGSYRVVKNSDNPIKIDNRKKLKVGLLVGKSTQQKHFLWVCVRECMPIHALGKNYKIFSYDYPAMQSLNYAFLHLIVYSKHRYSVQWVTLYTRSTVRGGLIRQNTISLAIRPCSTIKHWQGWLRDTRYVMHRKQ